MKLDRSHRVSLATHTLLSERLEPHSLQDWSPRILANIERMSRQVSGRTHRKSLDRWRELVRNQDVDGMKHAMTGVDPVSVQMREMGPFLGLVSEEERQQAIRSARQKRVAA